MSVYSSSEIRNSAALEAEAEFGLCCIEQFCMTLRADSSVLEVGSGPGLLLSNLHKNFPNLKFEGIEPYTSGYQGTKSKSHCGKNWNQLTPSRQPHKNSGRLDRSGEEQLGSRNAGPRKEQTLSRNLSYTSC